jgi:phosphoribosylglycinamide formyltransferase 1
MEIVKVISDRHDAGALDLATAAGIETQVVDYSDYPNRDAFSQAIVEAASGVEALILAGFMRILAPVAIRAFPHRILNIHPSLLPAFSGAHAVPEALAFGVKLTGVSVHFVDEEVDHGPIIAQEAVRVIDGDTESTLHSRIQKVEHELYPKVVAAFVKGRLDVRGREVVWT